jgi:hypothetical protein
MLFAEPESPSLIASEPSKIRSLMLKGMVRAKRMGLWFRLSRIERSIYSLAIKLKVKVQSYELIKAIISILKKIKSMSSNMYSLFTRGTSIAWLFSEFAVRLGNASAYEWRRDRNYIIYLASSFV